MILLEILSLKTYTICWVEVLKKFSALNHFERTGFVLGYENYDLRLC